MRYLSYGAAILLISVATISPVRSADNSGFRGLAIGTKVSDIKKILGDDFTIIGPSSNLANSDSIVLAKDNTACGSALIKNDRIVRLKLIPCFFDAEKMETIEFMKQIHSHYNLTGTKEEYIDKGPGDGSGKISFKTPFNEIMLVTMTQDWDPITPPIILEIWKLGKQP